MEGRVVPTMGMGIYRNHMSDEFVRLMQRYQTKDLVNTDERLFRERIDHFLNLRDYTSEGYGDASKQRDLSIQFYWGHNHDFGAFSVKGMLGNNHIELISAFSDHLRVMPRALKHRRILDVGCWTGGTSLLLAAMGADVVAIDEVNKYIDCLSYLTTSFRIENLQPRRLSIYDCVTEELQDAFDYVLFCGVLYHVSDPILALRIVFNCLKDGGKCLIETAIRPSDDLTLGYEGPLAIWGGSAETMDRRGWNWFIPSPRVLGQMMRDVGFANVSIVPRASHRVFAVGTRQTHVDMLRSGLSVRSIR